MTVFEFYSDNKFTSEPDIRHSKTQFYKESDIPVHYVKLPRPVQNFNFMTLSKNALEACQEDPDALMNLETSFDETYGWKAQVPDSSPKAELKFNWKKISN